MFQKPQYSIYAVGEMSNPKSSLPKLLTAPLCRAATGSKRYRLAPPYHQLDPILEAYVEQDLGIDGLINAGFDPELAKRVIHAVELSEYKRRQSPPGVKITPRSFDRDRRMPIVNRYRN